MDWNKAKTILIISFALLNAVLGYQLYRSLTEQNDANVVSSETVRELNDLLASKEIELEDTLPRDLQQMGYLSARLEREDKKWRPIEPPIEVNADDDAGKAKEKLQSTIPAIRQYTLDTAVERTGAWTYFQKVDQFPIYVAPLTVKQDGSRLTAYKQVAVKLESKEKMSLVVPAHVAVKSVVDSGLIPSGSTINEVRLGYIGRLNKRESQSLVPVWRIAVAGQQPLYVNALTGGLESDGWKKD